MYECMYVVCIECELNLCNIHEILYIIIILSFSVSHFLKRIQN